MTDRYQEAKALFLEAVEIEDPGARATFLRARCGDDAELRAEVEGMLASDAEEGLLDLAEGDTPGGVLPLREGVQVGDRIGDYELTERIAAGGMGTVFRAVRADDEYEQTVAVKVMRRGVASDELLRRFRVERQTLARLNHPNIARLLDGGTSASGHQYLVMEYVEGARIDEHCDEQRLDVTARVRLFREVCAAVHYAHQNLVVHRDLKPSNILVDVDGVPKLLDFGIAKELRPKGEGGITRTTTRMMTPEYASPEQIRGESVTTASDVYSLGVLLYKLLTGRSPYRLPGRMPHELENAICEQDPDLPSRRVTEEVPPVADPGEREPTTTELSARRSSDGRRLRRLLSGDLDTIVLKALRKEPTRRYPSVDELSEDLRRYLEGLPILARKDTFGYRTGKLVRRNKLATGAACLALVSLGSGVGGTLRYAEAATKQRDQAESASQRADREARVAKDEARRARLVNNLLTRLLASARPDLDGHDVRVRDVLDRTSAEIEELLADEPAVEAEVRTTVARTYLALGDFERAKQHFTRALELRRQVFDGEHALVATSLAQVGEVELELGDLDDAYEALHQALAMQRRLGLREEDMSHVLMLIARIHVRRAEHGRAEAYYLDALALQKEIDPESLVVAVLQNDLAASYHAASEKLQEAEVLLEEAIVLGLKHYPQEHTSLAQWMSNLGMIKHKLEKRGEARDLQTRALAMRRKLLPPGHPHLAMAIIAVARYDLQDGLFLEAEAKLREAIRILEESHGDDHPNLISSYSNLARTLITQERIDEAEAACDRALEIARTQFNSSHPDMARVLSMRGMVHRNAGRFDAAERDYRRALDMRIEHFGEVHVEVAENYNSLGRIYYDQGNFTGALEMYTELLAVRRELHPPMHGRVGDAVWSVAITRAKTGAYEEAIPELREYLTILASREGPPTALTGLGRGLLGECLTAVGQFEEAEEQLLGSREVYDVTLGPDSPAYHGALRRLVALYDRWDRPEEAAAWRAKLTELGVSEQD